MSAFKNRTAKKMRTLLSRGKSYARSAIPGRRARQRLVDKDGEILALKKELTRARGAARGLDPSSETTPVFFIVGNQKSGTTWLMSMLNAHPEILCQGEGRPFGRNWRQEHLKEKRVSYPPTSLYNAILSAEDLRYWVERSVWTRRDDPDEHLNTLTRLAIEYFLTRQLVTSGKKFVGDKTVLSDPGVMEEISRICPDAKVIHIVRDGRDVMVSQTHHRWNQAEDQGGTARIHPEQLEKREAYRKDPQKLLETDQGIFPRDQVRKHASKWRVRVGEAVENGPALLGSNYAQVRYEDLLESPEEELERLLRFLGAEASELSVRQCVEAASFEKLSGGRQRGQEAASFFRKGIAGDWKNVFTGQNKQDFKIAAGDLLIKLGYEKDKNW